VEAVEISLARDGITLTEKLFPSRPLSTILSCQERQQWDAIAVLLFWSKT